MTVSPRVQIVDYRLGNLFSVRQACEQAGLSAFVSDSPADLLTADAIILPGVGAFGQAMQNLAIRGLVEPLRERVAAGCPILGICLGMQLLFEASEEFGQHAGLGILPGFVRRLPEQWTQKLEPSAVNGRATCAVPAASAAPAVCDAAIASRRMRIPHVGWQRTFVAAQSAGHPLLAGIPDGTHFYYVHSYYVDPADASDILACTNFGQFCYCSAVHQANVTGVQFHPERSGEAGLRIYRNWAQRLKCGGGSIVSVSECGGVTEPLTGMDTILLRENLI